MSVKMIKQAYAATLVVGGKDVPPGTLVSLPEKEANKLASIFGLIGERGIAEPVGDKRNRKAAAQKTELEALQKAADDAREVYDKAQNELESASEADAEAALKAFEAAEAALDVAEGALAEASA